MLNETFRVIFKHCVQGDVEKIHPAFPPLLGPRGVITRKTHKRAEEESKIFATYCCSQIRGFSDF